LDLYKKVIIGVDFVIKNDTQYINDTIIDSVEDLQNYFSNMEFVSYKYEEDHNFITKIMIIISKIVIYFDLESEIENDLQMYVYLIALMTEGIIVSIKNESISMHEILNQQLFLKDLINHSKLPIKPKIHVIEDPQKQYVGEYVEKHGKLFFNGYGVLKQRIGSSYIISRGVFINNKLK